MKYTYIYPLLFLNLLGNGRTAMAAEKTSSPSLNIIYVLADDLGYGELGCYGQKLIETPNIDKLAQEGMVFTNYYSGSPVSAPARCVLLTGKHSGHSGIRGNDEREERGNVWDFLEVEKDSTLEGQQSLPEGSLTFVSLLQQKGYKTGAVGKWGLGAPGTESLPGDHGFDFFYGYNCQRQAHTYYPYHLYRNEQREYLGNETPVPNTMLDSGADPYDMASYAKYTSNIYSPDKMQEEAMTFIKENKNAPFFLYYATPLPHVPIQAPQRLVDHYVKKFGDEKPYEGQAGYFPTRYPHAGYAAMVTYIDEKVGELVNYLKENNLYDNTMIIISSDNGPTFNGGSDSSWFNSGGPFRSEYGWGKCFLKEGGIRVPLIVTWKDGIKAGTTSDFMCVSYDMFATISDLTGVEGIPETDGISLVPTLTNKGIQRKHDYLYWEFMDLDGQQAVRFGNWKGIRNQVKKGNGDIELYNLDTDIQELNNVASQHPEIVRRMEEIMKEEHITPFYKIFRVDLLDSFGGTMETGGS